MQGSGTFVAEVAAPSPESMLRAEQRLIGVICQHLQTVHAVAILQGISTACRDLDYHFLLFESAADAGIEAESLRRACAAGAAGLIIYPVDGFDNVDRFDALHQTGVPLVMVDRYYPSIVTDVIVPDNMGLAEDVVDHLVPLGHRRIALVGGDSTLATSSLDRAAGYRLALRKHGIPFDPALAAHHPFGALDDRSRRALVSAWRSPTPPTAYLALAAPALVPLVAVFRDLGIDPNTVALAAMDNLGPDTVLNRATVTAHLPHSENGL